MVAPWDIYAAKLFSLGYGHPLWIPEPSREFGEVHVGDIGYLSNGRFCFLFNCTRPEDDPTNVRGTPVGYRPLDLPSGSLAQTPDEITQSLLQSEGIHSVSFEGQASIGPSNNSVVQGGAQAGLRYRCAEQSGALLMLKQPAHGTRLHCTLDVQSYMREHLSSWHAFATDTLGIDLHESDLVFVYGHTKTTVWAEAAFSSETTNCELIVAAGIFGTPVNVSASSAFSVAISNCQLPTLFHRSGPQGRISASGASHETDAPSRFDQCIFVNYFKMKRNLLLRKTIRAAAGPDQLPPGERGNEESSAVPVFDTESEGGRLSNTNTEIFDPVTELLNRILEHPGVQYAWASDQDVVKVMKLATDQAAVQSSSDRMLFKAAVDAISPRITTVNGLGLISWATIPTVSRPLERRDVTPTMPRVSTATQPIQRNSSAATHLSRPRGGGASDHWLSELNNYCQRNKLQPEWQDTRSGPQRTSTWTSSVSILGVEYGQGTALTKRTAREIAAEQTLRMLWTSRM